MEDTSICVCAVVFLKRFYRVCILSIISDYCCRLRVFLLLSEFQRSFDVKIVLLVLCLHSVLYVGLYLYILSILFPMFLLVIMVRGHLIL